MEYLPKYDEQLLHWLKNFSDQLPSTGLSLGVTPAEIASLNALILDVKTDIRQGRVNDEEIKKSKMLAFLKGLVDKMKEHPEYKEKVHGIKLGIA